MTFGADILLAIFIALGPTPAHAADSGDFAGSVDIGGGRKMYLECRGSGLPTVVLVAGLSSARRRHCVKCRSSYCRRTGAGDRNSRQ